MLQEKSIKVSTLTGVKKDSATNLALEFSYKEVSDQDTQRNQQIIAYEKLHFGYLLVDLFHELYYKINKFVLEHSFGMEVRYQK